MQDLELPIGFRSEIIGPLLQVLAAGESSSLVGVGSAGKSNIVRHLIRRDVLQAHLGDAARSVLVLYIDCQKLADYTAQALHSLILEELPRAAQLAGSEVALLSPNLATLWEQAAGAGSPDRVRHVLEESVAAVLQAGIQQLFILLDDFDPVVQQAPARVLNSLRALRDQYKSQIVYVTVTRRELAFLRNENEYQDFYELVTAATFAIGPYREDDATFMIDRLSSRWNLPRRLGDAEIQRVLELSGRHPGLILALLRALRHDEKLSLIAPDSHEQLARHPDVEPECAKIWESLEKEETADLITLVSQGWPIGAGIRPLERKGLIRKRLDDTYDVFSPIFVEFVWDNLPDGRYAIKFVPEQREVGLHGRVIQLADETEFRLFSTLFEQRPKAVAREELIRSMVETEPTPRRFPGPPDQRLESYLAELKHKIDSIRQAFILAEPDGSYRLIGSEGQ
ncbi:MAG TPA: hypothetical protein VJG32_19775 [Anaerolineae bacterium]|nr:hypothetical protein [Anaerolineae bacterium]